MQREREKHEKHTEANSRKKAEEKQNFIFFFSVGGAVQKAQAWFFLVTVLLPLGKVSLTVQWDWTDASARFGGVWLVV